MALAVVGMPIDKLPAEVIGRILEGGASVCRAAGIPVAGGHSIDTLEPIYGLVALGVVHPEKVKTNAGARAGDTLILSKPLGVGVLSAGLKKGLLSAEQYAEMLRWTTTLNRVGARLAHLPGVHALTDVTGFGLAGHLLEVCRASRLGAEVHARQLPIIDAALSLAKSGIATGASNRNWASYGSAVSLPGAAPAHVQTLVTDPQTSGGLLIACAPEAEQDVMTLVREVQGNEAWVVGGAWSRVSHASASRDWPSGRIHFRVRAQ
jgi:selenide,water dikinase